MKIKYFFTPFILSLALLYFSSKQLSASSLVVVSKDGDVNVNVLSSEIALDIPQRESLQVKNIVNVTTSSGSQKINLSNVDGRVTLKVTVDGVEKELDLTNYNDEVIEIEERPQSQRIKIHVENGNFIIEQDGVVTKTTLPINVDSESAELSVRTNTGVKYLAILPQEALSSAARAKIMSKVSDVELVEDKDILIYKITGERGINVFNLMDYSVPIEAQVSATDGKLVFTNEPVWLKLLGFLFE